MNHSTMRRGVWCKAVVTFSWWLAVQLAVANAHGQRSTTPGDQADSMFQTGRTLLANGEIVQACGAFAKSYELRPRHGTLLNLAVCLEQQGDIVAAFRRFEESLSAAISDGRVDREQLARSHLEGLKAKLAWLSIQLDFEADLRDLQVTCDGVALAKNANGPLPLEPGSHVVKASAPGRIAFEATVTTVAGNSETVRIPVLAALQEPTPMPTPAPTPAPTITTPLTASPLLGSKPRAPVPAKESAPQWRGPLSISLLAAGTAALSAGAIFGVRAIVDGGAVERLCVDRRCTTDASLSTARRLEDRARVEARVANITLPLGAIALGVSAYLFWTKPRQPRPTDSVGQLQLAPTASLNAVGTSLRGTW